MPRHERTYSSTRPRWHRKYLVSNAALFPTLATNICCQRIQSVWRGFASRRKQAKAVPGVASAGDDSKYQLSAFDRRFLAFVARHKLEPSAGSLLLLSCLRLQAWWRMQLTRRRAKRQLFASFSRSAHVLASSIQTWFRNNRSKRRIRRKPRSKPFAAWLIQRAWTRHLDRRTYRYFRDLLAFRNAGEPVTMVR